MNEIRQKRQPTKFFFELIKLIAGLFALISGQTEWVDPIYDDKATFPQNLTNMQQMLRTMPYFPEGMAFNIDIK